LSPRGCPDPVRPTPDPCPRGRLRVRRSFPASFSARVRSASRDRRAR
jgi:hypothetical protein